MSRPRVGCHSACVTTFSERRLGPQLVPLLIITPPRWLTCAGTATSRPNYCPNIEDRPSITLLVYNDPLADSRAARPRRDSGGRRARRHPPAPLSEMLTTLPGLAMLQNNSSATHIELYAQAYPLRTGKPLPTTALPQVLDA